MRVLVIYFVLIAESIHGQSFQKIDSLLATAQNSKKPGGVIAVMNGDKVIYKKAVGYADLSRGILNTFNHKYDIASIAKQFTAMCIALLEEQEKISREDLLSTHYPEFKLPQTIKIKNLLDHTSGIREAYVLATLSGKVNLKGELRKKFNTKTYLFEMLKRERDLNFTPGSELAYTNVNYILLADIVERISKRPFHEFADSAIFKPLAMTNTFYRYKQRLVIGGEAKGYLVKGKRYKPVKASGGILGDGKLETTIDDLIKWELNLRHNKLGRANQKLTEKLYASSTLNNGELTHYGYGFWSVDYRGLKTINHGGDDGRFTSFILKFPEHDIVIITLANTSLYNNTRSTAYQIADILLEKTFVTPKAKPETYQWVASPRTELQSKEGIYQRIDEKGLGSMRRFKLIGDSLYVNSGLNGKGLLCKPVSDNFFVAKNRFGGVLKFSFQKDSSGVYFEEQFHDNKKIRFYLVNHQEPPKADFIGTYFNETTTARLKVKRNKGRLLAKKGIIKIPMVAFNAGQYYAYQNDALFIFQRDEKGKVNSLKVNASDFRNFIFKKVK